MYISKSFVILKYILSIPRSYLRFYEGLAAVETPLGCYHIRPNGNKAYEKLFAWCGNFHSVPIMGKLCAVQQADGDYSYIKDTGDQFLGQFSYCGDFSSQGFAVAYSLDGYPGLVSSFDGSFSLLGTRVWEATPPHKQMFTIRGEGGWTFAKQCSSPMSQNQAPYEAGTDKRFLSLENFYNGRARAQLPTGDRVIVDEDGRNVNYLKTTVEEDQCALEDTARNYWASLALKMVIDSEISKDSLGTGSQREKILRDFCIEQGILRDDSTSTRKGKELMEPGRTSARCRYWLQDRYLEAWIHAFPDLSDKLSLQRQKPKTAGNHFESLSLDPSAVLLSQSVLAGYARDDWYVNERISYSLT